MRYCAEIVADVPPPVCPDCTLPFTLVEVRFWLHLHDPARLIDTDTLTWVPGLAQYNLSPGWLGWQEEELGYLELACTTPGCTFATCNVELRAAPSGIRFDDTLVMETRL